MQRGRRSDSAGTAVRPRHRERRPVCSGGLPRHEASGARMPRGVRRRPHLRAEVGYGYIIAGDSPPMRSTTPGRWSDFRRSRTRRPRLRGSSPATATGTAACSCSARRSFLRELGIHAPSHPQRGREGPRTRGAGPRISAPRCAGLRAVAGHLRGLRRDGAHVHRPRSAPGRRLAGRGVLGEPGGALAGKMKQATWSGAMPSCRAPAIRSSTAAPDWWPPSA